MFSEAKKNFCKEKRIIKRKELFFVLNLGYYFYLINYFIF